MQSATWITLALTIISVAVTIIAAIWTRQTKKAQATRTVIGGLVATIVFLIITGAFYVSDVRQTQSQAPTPALESVAAFPVVPADGTESEQVKAAIRNANAAEFRAYKALPSVNLGEIRKYFVESGPAYQQIANLLIAHQSKGRVITNPGNPSRAQIISIEDPIVTGKMATVKTREHWVLQWYEAGTAKEGVASPPSISDNPHKYVLRSIDGAWKVERDDYVLPPV